MPDTSIARRWRPTGRVPSTALTDARLQTHHAAQLVVSAGISYLAAQPDDSHTNMEWIPELSAIAGNVLSVADGTRLALRPADLTLMVIDGSGVADELSLDGRTIADGDMWTRRVLAARGFEAGRLTQRKHYEIPAHAVASGAPFSLSPSGSNAELSAFFHNAWWLTNSLRPSHAEASEPRLWPHHFDLAILIPVATRNGSGERTIGVGISPGDDSYDQPYIYVGPRPYPPMSLLPPLDLGQWHTEGWTGAVLTGSAFPGETGAERALTFARHAVAACERAFGGM